MGGGASMAQFGSPEPLAARPRLFQLPDSWVPLSPEQAGSTCVEPSSGASWDPQGPVQGSPPPHPLAITATWEGLPEQGSRALPQALWSCSWAPGAGIRT